MTAINNYQDQTERDMMEFVDLSIDGFLNDLNLVVASYTGMFFTKSLQYEDFVDDARADLNQFVWTSTWHWYKIALISRRDEVIPEFCYELWIDCIVDC